MVYKWSLKKTCSNHGEKQQGENHGQPPADRSSETARVFSLWYLLRPPGTLCLTWDKWIIGIWTLMVYEWDIGSSMACWWDMIGSLLGSSWDIAEMLGFYLGNSFRKTMFSFAWHTRVSSEISPRLRPIQWVDCTVLTKKNNLREWYTTVSKQLFTKMLSATLSQTGSPWKTRGVSFISHWYYFNYLLVIHWKMSDFIWSFPDFSWVLTSFQTCLEDIQDFKALSIETAAAAVWNLSIRGSRQKVNRHKLFGCDLRMRVGTWTGGGFPHQIPLGVLELEFFDVFCQGTRTNDNKNALML